MLSAYLLKMVFELLSAAVIRGLSRNRVLLLFSWLFLIQADLRVDTFALGQIVFIIILGGGVVGCVALTKEEIDVLDNSFVHLGILFVSRDSMKRLGNSLSLRSGVFHKIFVISVLISSMVVKEVLLKVRDELSLVLGEKNTSEESESSEFLGDVSDVQLPVNLFNTHIKQLILRFSSLSVA